MKWLFGILFLTLSCYVSGMRLHPENFKKYFGRESYANYLEVFFNSGSRVAGRKINETAQTLEIGAGGGTAVFSKKEIARVQALDPAEVRAGRYADVILHEHSTATPLLTLRYEDRLYSAIEKRIERFFSRVMRHFHNNDGSSKNEAGPVALPISGTQANTAGLASLLQPEGGGGREDYSALIQKGLEEFKKQRA